MLSVCEYGNPETNCHTPVTPRTHLPASHMPVTPSAHLPALHTPVTPSAHLPTSQLCTCVPYWCYYLAVATDTLYILLLKEVVHFPQSFLPFYLNPMIWQPSYFVSQQLLPVSWLSSSLLSLSTWKKKICCFYFLPDVCLFSSVCFQTCLSNTCSIFKNSWGCHCAQ